MYPGGGKTFRVVGPLHGMRSQGKPRGRHICAHGGAIVRCWGPHVPGSFVLGRARVRGRYVPTLERKYHTYFSVCAPMWVPRTFEALPFPGVSGDVVW
jgi:hypothetical protein